MTTLQIRNMPEEVSRILKMRAVAAGQSLSEYALSQLLRSAQTPTFDEVSARIDLRGRVDLGTSGVDILRAERDAR